MTLTMKSLHKIIFGVLFFGLIFISCDGAFDSLVDTRVSENPVPDMEIEANAGSADFSNYVAIGNSLTAGFQDAALYNTGQRFSLAAQLNGQFEYVGGTTSFNQPDINSVNGFNTSVNQGSGAILGRFKLDTSIPGPSPTINGDQIGPYTGTTSELNNFGVPGIQIGQLLTPDTGNPSSPAFNPFYARFASNPGSSTILEDAISANPTFFSLWIGNNDVLGYALSGATNNAIFTGPTEFQQRFEGVIGTLMTETQAKGVVASIPQVLAIPFFRAVPYNAVPLDQTTAEQVNQGFAGFHQVLDGLVANLGHDPDDADRRRVNYQAGQNQILIVDRDLENLGPKFDTLVMFGAITQEEREALEPYVQSRPITQGELVLLSAASVLGTLANPDNPQSVVGVVVPLNESLVLTNQNMIEIETRRQTFNAIMDGVVQDANANFSSRLAYYDTDGSNSTFTTLFGLDGSNLGVQVGSGIRLAPDFSPNGVFSTDGVHPNHRGNALLANDFIEVIESAFGATIPKVNVLNLPSVAVCAGDCVSQQGGS